MTDPQTTPSRRDFLKTTGLVAAASAFSQTAVPLVHAGESNTIQVALVGCGGRGTGAAANALSDQERPDQARRHGRRLRGPARQQLRRPQQGRFAKQVDVPEDRKFIGFDGYKKAMDCLKPGDVVILATPPAFRWVHFTYAIEKGLNVFMEKPVTVDGPTTRKMLALAEESMKKNLKVGVGLMCRHCEARERAVRPHQGRRDRRHHRCCGPTA